MIQAIIFDLFETLVTEGGPKTEQKPSVAQRLGMDEQAFRAEWRSRQERRMTGVFPDYSSALLDVCTALDCGTEYGLVKQLESERLVRFAGLFADPDPDVIDTLREIRQVNIKIGLVSNASSDEIAAWEDCQLSRLIDVAVFSCQVGCMKPDPAIYLIACERLELAPEDCIYIGDGGFGELPAAVHLGMSTYCATWYRDRWPDGDGPMPDVQCPKLPSFSKMLDVVREAVGSVQS